jgi:hypothetical protein
LHARQVSKLGVALALAFVAVVLALVVVRDRWERWWFEHEDPRSIGIYRIAFAALLLWDVNGLWPHFEQLFLADDPRTFWGLLVVFELAAFTFMVGFATRLSGLVALVCTDAIFARNPVFWEGTELVLLVFGVLLVCSRCGASYSVDASPRPPHPSSQTATRSRLHTHACNR